MRSQVTPRRRLRPLIILGYLALSLAACGKGVEPDAPPDKGVIRFSLISAGSAKVVSQDWAPILADMAARTGLKVEPYYAVGEAQQAEAMRRGKTDAGWFSNAAGLQAVRRGVARFSSAPSPVGIATVIARF